LRPGGGLRHAPGRDRGRGGAVRAGRHPPGGAGPDRRAAGRHRVRRPGGRAAGRARRPRAGPGAGPGLRIRGLRGSARGGGVVTGPTAGDLIELADTGLVVRVEADAQRAGDEFRTGFGKTARDGMHLRAATASETCDIVITNVTLLDPVLGIRTVSIGVRAGRISAIGRAGNPDTLDGVDVIVGTGTTIIPGEGLLATPGAVDTHVHLLSPRVLEVSLTYAVTTE